MKRWRNCQRAEHYKRRRKRWEQMRQTLRPVDAEDQRDIATIIREQLNQHNNEGDIHYDN